MRPGFWQLAAFLLAIALPSVTLSAELQVRPAAVVLDRPEASQQLLVSVADAASRLLDVTRTSRYEVLPPDLATIDAMGLVRPLKEGRGEIVIHGESGTARLALEVHGLATPPAVSFQYEILPILTKARCNAGGCHGKAEGQNGFKLSIFGFDTAADHAALVSESQGRRVSLTQPGQSLVLQKGAALMPHGGGRKLEEGKNRYRLLLRWLQEGAPYTTPNEGPIQRIEVEPATQVLTAGQTQQLQVTAIATDGSRRCVTVDAEYESNAGTIISADDRGLLSAADIPGEAAILVRYLDQVAVARVTSPRPGVVVQRPPEQNFIDGHIWNKLTTLGIEPSTLADDAMFLRRVYLDTIGTLPTADEARAFLADTRPDKRALLVDQLLARPEYTDFWTMRWSNVLRIDQSAITPQGAVGMTRWLRAQIAANTPYDEFVRQILTSQGNTTAESPAAFFKSLDTAELASRSVSQLFLGVRIECAQCHHHPSEKWGQDDYFAFTGFFTGIKRKPLPGGGEAIVSRGGNDLVHTRTGLTVPTHALGAPVPELGPSDDRRLTLAKWLTAADNQHFTKMIVNRTWAHYFGRGLVEPIDDIRATNPASNEPLFEALCAHMREVKYDLRAFTRTLLASQAYQLSSVPTDSNVDDRQNFSHALDKALTAEVLLDMVSQTTGVPEKFNGWPLGYRSIQLWDSRVPTYFFRIFGRPVRASVCECERSNEPSIAQALHLLNSPEVMEKIQHKHGVARRLARAQKTDDEVIDELYLSTLSRLPREDERTLIRQAISESGNRREAVEDILWTVLNTKEFLYNH